MLQEIHCLKGFTDGTVAALAREGLEETHKKIEADRKSDHVLLVGPSNELSRETDTFQEGRSSFACQGLRDDAERVCLTLLPDEATKRRGTRSVAKNTEPPSQNILAINPGFFTCLKPRLLKDNFKDRHFSS